MRFSAELFAIIGAGISIGAVVFALIRNLFRVIAEKQLIRNTQLKMRLTRLGDLDLSDIASIRGLSNDQVEELRRLLEEEARALTGPRRRILEEGLEQSSELGRSEYTKKLLSESRKAIPAR